MVNLLIENGGFDIKKNVVCEIVFVNNWIFIV